MNVILRRAFVSACVAWALLLVAVPFLASRAHATAAATAIVVAVYGIGALVCHQLPDRSYWLWSAQMPVCARCAGIYAGAAASAVAVAWTRWRVSGTLAARLALAVAAAPTAATLVYEWTTGHMPAHAIRFAAGAPLGIVAAWLVVAAAENQVN